MPISYTAQQQGYYRVQVNGVEVSKHLTEREALERAQDEESLDPTRDVVVTHDYAVKVEDSAVAVDIIDGEVAELTLVASNPALVTIAGTVKVTALTGAGSVVLDLVRIR